MCHRLWFGEGVWSVKCPIAWWLRCAQSAEFIAIVSIQIDTDTMSIVFGASIFAPHAIGRVGEFITIWIDQWLDVPAIQLQNSFGSNESKFSWIDELHTNFCLWRIWEENPIFSRCNSRWTTLLPGWPIRVHVYHHRPKLPYSLVYHSIRCLTEFENRFIHNFSQSIWRVFLPHHFERSSLERMADCEHCAYAGISFGQIVHIFEDVIGTVEIIPRHAMAGRIINWNECAQIIIRNAMNHLSIWEIFNHLNLNRWRHNRSKNSNETLSIAYHRTILLIQSVDV